MITTSCKPGRPLASLIIKTRHTMRISSPFEPRDRRGYALIITLVFLAITLVSLASVMWWASSNGKVTQQNELFTTAEAAAEAATEKVVAQLDRDWTYSQ